MDKKVFLVDVGMNGLPFPMRVASKIDPEGQSTISNISISARIMQEFEVQWIDKFIKILHQHREKIGTKTLRGNIMDYLKELQASMITIDFQYPFFIEKLTPVSKEKCLVRYLCSYTAKKSSIDHEPRILFKMEVPVITTYPQSTGDEEQGLFAQLSIVQVELESAQDVFPEDIVAMVEKHALMPIYSYLSEDDQKFIIKELHSKHKSSIVTVDEIKDELAHNRGIEWYLVKCSNFGMLHSYSTVISTEKSNWVPFSGYETQEV